MRRLPFFFPKSSELGETGVRGGIIYEFADFRLIPDDDLLLRNGEPVPLPPKAYETLALLIERHGHLVKKSELIEKVWSGTFVEEAAVSKCVWTIRTALGEDAKSHHFIQTVPKRGYKFVARVSILEEAMNGDGRGNGWPGTTVANSRRTISQIDQTDDEISSAKWSVMHWLMAAIAAVALTLVGIYLITFFRQPGGVHGTSHSIAVLPLRAVNADVIDHRYELGIADALILKLSSSKTFAVRPLHSVQGYSDQKKDAIEAGREQKVQYVLSSNYQIADGRIRVTSQLFNLADGLVEDTFKVEKALTDFFSVQDAVASDLGNSLLARFAAEPGAVKTRGTSNEEAYRHYLQASYLSTQRRPGSILRSIEEFDRAVDLDPKYAQAWAAKAHAHVTSGSNMANVSSSEANSKARESIDRALALDPHLPEAHSALCNLKTGEFDFAGSEAACKRALELGPDSSKAHQAYSIYLSTRNLTEEAVAEMQIAIDLDPTSYEMHRSYANSLYFARRYEEADAQYIRLIEMDPGAVATYNWLIRSLEAQGREADAFEWFIKFLITRNSDESVIQSFKNAYHQSGYRGVLLQRIASSDGTRFFNDFRMAGWYAKAGNKDKAFEFLERAYEKREAVMGWIRIEPQLDSLRDDPRYDAIVARMHFR